MLQSSRWCISLGVIRQSKSLPGSVSGLMGRLECADERWSCRRKISISYRSQRRPIMLGSSQLGAYNLVCWMRHKRRVTTSVRQRGRARGKRPNPVTRVIISVSAYCGVSHHVNGVQRPHPCTRCRYNLINRFSLFLFFPSKHPMEHSVLHLNALYQVDW